MIPELDLALVPKDPHGDDVQEAFIIESPSAADWAVEQIKAERARRDMYTNAARERIAEYEEKIRIANEKCENNTSYLLFKLNEYLDTVPAKKTKTQLSLDLPAGKLVRTLPKLDYERDPEALLDFVRKEKPELLKIKEEVNWADLKKLLDPVEGVAVMKDTGCVVEGIRVVEKPESFDIKF